MHAYADEDASISPVLVSATGCVVPCSHGLLVVVHADDTWYERIDPAKAVRIADEHLRQARRQPATTGPVADDR